MNGMKNLTPGFVQEKLKRKEFLVAPTPIESRRSDVWKHFHGVLDNNNVIVPNFTFAFHVKM